MHVYMYLSICLVTPPKKNTVFTFLLVFKVFFVFSPIFFWHLFSCHFWLPLKYLEFAINCIKLQNVSDWRLEIEDSQKNFFNPGLDWRFEDWRFSEKLEDWRFSEKLLQSRSRLKKSFWESSIFNLDLDWRSFSENLQSSIFSPDLDWRSFSENLQSSIFNPDLDWRSFSENLQSPIFSPIHFAI